MTDFITQKLTVNPNGVGDFAAEWMTKEDWDNYANLGINKPHQESYVAEVTLARNPLFDDAHGVTVESYRTAILDLSKTDFSKNKSMPIFYGTKENNK